MPKYELKPLDVSPVLLYYQAVILSIKIGEAMSAAHYAGHEALARRAARVYGKAIARRDRRGEIAHQRLVEGK